VLPVSHNAKLLGKAMTFQLDAVSFRPVHACALIERRKDLHPSTIMCCFRRRRRLIVLLATAIASCGGLMGAPRPASAVILYRTATRNWTAPTGMKTNSGWQWAGKFGGFEGTPIGKYYFLTASHIGGGVGTPLILNNKTYNTTAMYDDPSSDLRIFKVSTPFTSWAPLYTGSSETGKWAVVYGRGTQRGSVLTKNGVTKGWKWGTDDRYRSWGENYVSGAINGGGSYGQLLKFTFSSDRQLASEGTLSTGDSGGAVFIRDGSSWKLAGINYLVDGPFSTSGSNGSGVNASVYDKGGLYTGGDGAWKYTPDTSSNIPGDWYATRVSSRISWIKSVTGAISASPAELSLSNVPEPLSLTGVVSIGAIAFLRRKRRN
jgi:hypothetical protein